MSRIIVVALALLALVVSACGGEDEPATPKSEPAPAAAQSADLGAIKAYLLDHTQRLVTSVGTLLPPHQRATGQALLQTTLMGVAPIVGASLGGFTYERSPALLFGLIPSLRYSAANLNRTLRAGGRGSRSDSGRLRSLLVTGEVALALVVVVGASLLVRSLNKLLEVQPGFRPDHLLVATLALPPMHYKQTDVHNFYVRLLPKIAALPGVVSVATTTALTSG